MGRAWVYGDNVDTDVIIPARYLTSTEPDVLAAHALEDLDPAFASEVRPGDVVIAGFNFGCGSSREHAALALKGSRITAVVAKSFARIFFRNAINTGLAICTCPEAVEAARPGDEVDADPTTGKVRNLTRGSEYTSEALPAFVLDIVAAGGLVPWVRERVRA